MDFEQYDYKGFIIEHITQKVFDLGVKTIRELISKYQGKEGSIILDTYSIDDIIENLAEEVKTSARWCQNISFRDISKEKSLIDIYVELDYYVSPKRNALTKESVKTIKAEEMLNFFENNLILLGDPGSGKTTTAKQIFLKLVGNISEENYFLPIFIRLRDIKFSNDETALLDILLEKLGIFFRVGDKEFSQSQRQSLKRRLFKIYMSKFPLMLILDGFDEVSNIKKRTFIISNLEFISHNLPNIRFLLTSRASDFNYHIDNSKIFEIKPLTTHQVRTFIFKWIKDEVDAKKLFEKLKKSPYWDTTLRPLTIAHLCAIYERDNSIPEKPNSIYKKIIELLLHDWNAQRRIKRISSYAKFDPIRKLEFLSRFAFEITILHQSVSFDSRILETIYNDICDDFDLPIKESKIVIKEIESHSGLILQTSIESFEFAHKSLQEYLTANYLSRLQYIISDSKILRLIPNELAITIAISADPDYYLYQLVIEIIDNSLFHTSFITSLFERLNLEKPDFVGSPLLSIAINHILKFQSKALVFYFKEAQNPNEYENIESVEPKIVERNMNLLVEFCRSEKVRKSHQLLSEYYEFTEINLKDDSEFIYLQEDEHVYYLSRNAVPFNIRHSYFKIPKSLILSPKVYKILND